MKRRDFLRLTFAMGLHAGLTGCSNGLSNNSAPINKTQRKPNVILIVSDDHGYADFSYKKIHDYIKTPNLDRLVSEAVEFTNGYATSPICSPSRCGLLTGRYQQRWGTFWYGGNGIPEGVPTIAERFRSLGYRTGYIGKLHYGKNVEQPGLRSYPTEHGFDECLCAPPGGRSHYQYHSEDAVKRFGSAGKMLFVDPMTKNGKDLNYEGFLTEKFGSAAQDFVSQNRERPFFLQLAFNAVHNFTFQLPGKYLKEWDLPEYPVLKDLKDYDDWYQRSISPNLVNGRKYYAAQLFYMDREIGKLMKKLKELGLDNDTIAVYTSDNGGSTCNCGDTHR